MSQVITFESDIANDGEGNGLALFDDDDPFSLPPPLPPLSPERDDNEAPRHHMIANFDDQDDADDQTAGGSNKKEPLKKRRVNRSPRPKLDETRLCGDRGIPALQHLCDGIKFKGKGHEASDLKLLMQRYEYWAHRLFPKFPFVDVVEQVENLSAKKLVQNCIKRIRRGEEEIVDEVENSDTELGANNETQDNDGAASQESGGQVANNLQTFGAQVEASDKMVILTPEQQERIRLNRERALAKRKAAQEKQVEQANAQTGETGKTDTQTAVSEDVAVDAFNNAGERDSGVGNLVASESNPIQEDDVEMRDETTEGDTVSLEHRELHSTTNEDPASSSLMTAANGSHAAVEDAEMGTESDDPVGGADDADTCNVSSFPDADNGNPNGTTSDDELCISTKELPPGVNDLHLRQATDGASFPARNNTDQSASAEQDGQALQQEVCVETLGSPTPPKKTTAVSDNGGHDGARVVEMETE